jgi:hypothetical protein
VLILGQIPIRLLKIIRELNKIPKIIKDSKILKILRDSKIFKILKDNKILKILRDSKFKILKDKTPRILIKINIMEFPITIKITIKFKTIPMSTIFKHKAKKD